MKRQLKDLLENGAFADVKDTTRKTMAAVKSSGNKTTERRFRMALVRSGIRGWRVRVRRLPGHPDFCFELLKIVVFVDGCFWHGCPRCGHVPKTRSAFWQAKIDNNRRRDQEVRQKLEQEGYLVFRFWEHETLAGPDLTPLADAIRQRDTQYAETNP